MTINDKIKQILIDKNLTPSYFADEIGVQRSSISHILSGRNRPSFDIIQKIIRRFPELGYEWIMEEDNQVGNQTPFNNRAVSRPTSDRFNSDTPTVNYTPSSPLIRTQRNEIPPVQLAPQPQEIQSAPLPTSTPTSEKKVERILIFYTDGSFREYSPAN
ncbi:helix-turn-helix transcriptional regulator [Spirosoma soli]|uniref:Helix-turn-helix transcriptional regulator n=1 Tax=Spirosoma soli TaxID=1770529 RepID=A0ABW5M5A8_9BACT